APLVTGVQTCALPIFMKNTETGAAQRRIDFWPFFTWRRDFNGNSRLQALSLLEPFLPNNKSIERNYSPLWSIWRAEKNPRTGGRSAERRAGKGVRCSG